MTPQEHELQQQKVIAIVNAINDVLAGLEFAEACTSLTLAVVSGIVATSDSPAERVSQAREFGKQVLDYVNREDIVEWMRAGITPMVPPARPQ